MAPAWTPFVVATGLLALVVVALARASADLLTGEEGPERIPTRVLVANVTVTQGVVGAVVVAAAWLAGVPRAALGVGPEAVGVGAVGTGVVLGASLFLASEAAARAVDESALVYAERLRERLAPTTPRGWVVLLVVVLPLVAGFEELLFRAALVGAPVAGLGVPAWLAALASSVLFGLAHGAQGRVGVVVTGALGLALAAAFVATGSLLVVVVAHYVVNAAEFVVHEGIGNGDGGNEDVETAA